MTPTDRRLMSRRPNVSALRGVVWVLGALAIVLIFEIFSDRVAPDVADRNNFFEYRYGHDELPERVLVNDKLALFEHDDPNIVQVGDSSAFHGVMPPVVEAIVPGSRYVNMSVFANLGYRGFYEMARAVLSRNKNVKVIVLYITPAGFQPNKVSVGAKNLLGEDIWREFGSPLHALFHIPSLALRREVTGLVYNGHATTIKERDFKALRRYPEAKALIPETGGWTRERDNTTDQATGAFESVRLAGAFPAGMPKSQAMAIMTAEYGESPMAFDWKGLRRISLAEQVYDEFRMLAESHGARLVIASAPVSEIFRDGDVGRKLAAFEETLEDYRAKHPTVGIIPMTYLPDGHFSSPVHVATPYTLQNSIRFATALKEAIGSVNMAPEKPLAPTRRPFVETMSAEDLTGYGFSTSVEGGARALRAGRNEGLIFARVKPGAKYVQFDVAPDTPRSVVDSLSVTVLGEVAERVDAITSSDSDSVRLTWRLPSSAMRFGGWLEVLLSTRGLRQWPGEEPEEGATGPQLKLKTIRFPAD